MPLKVGIIGPSRNANVMVIEMALAFSWRAIYVPALDAGLVDL